jgi:hypothetical protein
MPPSRYHGASIGVPAAAVAVALFAATSGHAGTSGHAAASGHAAVQAATPQAATVDVSGEWTLRMMAPQGLVNIELALEQEGTAVKGKLAGPMGEHEIEGAVEADRFSFSMTVESPTGGYTLHFSARVEDNETMAGVMRDGSGELAVDFTAARKESP